MKLRLSEEETSRLKAYIERDQDCEWLSVREAVMDLYGIGKPISVNFVFIKGGIGIDGAAELMYSESEDGYYMGERIEDPEYIRRAMIEAGVFTNYENE